MGKGRRKRNCIHFIKRLSDILLSSVMLLILWPVMAIIAICIRASDHAPATFAQKRLTKDRREFVLYKFRSMKPGAEEDYSLALAEDPRVTPVGKFIRKYRLDELPQLVNVLKGDMSMVGPRPERPHIAEAIEEELPRFRERLSVKAGLTGYAQVKGTYATPSEEKLAFDMYYIENFSLLLDLKILVWTVKVVLTPESAKGLEIEADEYFNNNRGQRFSARVRDAKR